jgi:hypothetical protein
MFLARNVYNCVVYENPPKCEEAIGIFFVGGREPCKRLARWESLVRLGFLGLETVGVFSAREQSAAASPAPLGLGSTLPCSILYQRLPLEGKVRRGGECVLGVRRRLHLGNESCVRICNGIRMSKLLNS